MSSGIGRAPDVFTARVLDEEAFVRQVTQHPGDDGIRESEEAPRFLAGHAETRHLFELGANAAHGRIP
jgi:hypothetical protein